jgi:hypothetical protein
VPKPQKSGGSDLVGELRDPQRVVVLLVVELPLLAIEGQNPAIALLPNAAFQSVPKFAYRRFVRETLPALVLLINEHLGRIRRAHEPFLEVWEDPLQDLMVGNGLPELKVNDDVLPVIQIVVKTEHS